MKRLGLVLGALLFGGVSGALAQGMAAPGQKLPEWRLPDSTGAMVSSADLAGKTYLLWFYPRAMTSGCTAEGCALRDASAEYKKRGIEILGVSFDSPEKNAEFIAKEHFPFRLLSDRDKSVAITLGAANSDKQLFARRVSYLVGPDGTVLKAYEKVDPAGHARQVLDDAGAAAPSQTK